MNKYKLIFIISLTIQSIVNCQWVQSDLINKDLFITAISAKDSVIFLGCKNFGDSVIVNYYYSKDYGTTWKESYSNNANHPNIFIISDNYIFAGDGYEGGNIYRTSDWGISWEKCFNNGIGVTSMAQYGNNIYAGTTSDFSFQGVWKSTDYGNNWIDIWQEGSVLSVRSLIAIDSFIIAGTSTIGVYGSSDNGETWHELNNGLPSNSYIKSMILFNNKIFAGVTYEEQKSGNYYSTDFGLNWLPLNDGIGDFSIHSFASDGNYLFSIAGSKVYVLLENENKWKEITDDLPDLYILSIAVSGDNLFLGAVENGLWYRKISNITKVINEKKKQDLFALSQNYPNPFNPTTKINYQLGRASNVTIKVFDCLGRLIKTLVDEYKPQGLYSLNFDASTLVSGIYFYQLSTDEFITTKKMIILQ
ncbi:MAG: T9SS type A sorting domain-containing protein [Ignavibacteriae bacterium]|nr:T9SS type A sorting domain-containing protein [Ignavibacteriota bacterium]